MKRIFYIKSGQLDSFKWVDIPDKDLKKAIPEKNELETTIGSLSNTIADIAIYLSAFGNLECFESEVADDKEVVDYKEIKNFILDECNVRSINPLLDKLVASAIVMTIIEIPDLKDESKIVLCITKYIISYLDALSASTIEDKQNDNCELDISKLKQGQVVKNYKELCDILNQDTKLANSKKAQLKEFERYFEYQKVGQKFLITYIYDNPLPRKDGRSSGKNSIYVTYIEAILLRYMSLQDGYTCVFTKRKILSLLGMINANYGNISMSALKELPWNDVPESSIQKMTTNFYFRCNQILDRVLFSALKSLRNRRLISYFEQVVIKDINGKYFIANDNQISRIDKIEKLILSEMGFVNITQVYCKFKSEDFYSRVNRKMRDIEGWEYSFRQYKLIYTPQIIKEELSIQDIELKKSLLNGKVIDAVNNNANSVYRNLEEKYEAEKKELDSMNFWYMNGSPTMSSKGLYKLPEFYVEAQMLLSEELLRYGKPLRKTIAEEVKEQDEELDLLFCQ